MKGSHSMRKVVLFMHVTLDGFVAGVNGEMDWIDHSEEIFEYADQLISQSDTALYGRITYQMMESFWPTAHQQPTATKHDIAHTSWYNKVSKFVVSRTMKDANLPNTTIINNHLVEEIVTLKQAQDKDILMFGSPTVAHALMAENLIDDYWLFVNPVLLGEGKSLFSDIKQRIHLKLTTSKTFASGTIGLHYQKVTNEQ